MSASQSASQETVIVSGHAQTRWNQRSPDPDVDVLEVWSEAVTVDYPPMHPPATEARYHSDTRMLLLAAGSTITTVIPLTHRPHSEQQYITSQVSDR